MKKILETALNRYLALDPESAKRIEALEGKVVTIELLATGVTFQMFFSAGRVVLAWQDFSPADIVIKGTPLNLLHMSLARDARNRFFAEDVIITGNMELARHVLAIFDDLEVDWEEWTSQYLGDVPAHQMGRVVKKIKSIGQTIRESLCRNVNEYVHEEIQLVPANEALQDFFTQVDDFRMDVDRLEARVAQLKKHFDEEGL